MKSHYNNFRQHKFYPSYSELVKDYYRYKRNLITHHNQYGNQMRRYIVEKHLPFFK